jgi:peroxiredoxin (alkyl hydroperoxide reductase subunit C)
MVSDYTWRWLILFFYPADFTFVCPTELKDLQKLYDDFAWLKDVDVLVGSTDSVFTHRAWVQKEWLVKDLQYPMFADRDTVMSKYFGILNHTTGHAERWTFIISPDGILKSVEVHTEPLWRSAKELLRKISWLKFITDNPWNACVASWEDESSPSLKPSLKITGEVEDAIS